jgi:hypothetical protein
MQPTELPYKEIPAIPPFLQENHIDPSTTLAYIQTEISNIYSAAKALDNDDAALQIEHDRYIKIYTAVFDFCKTAMQTSNSQPPAENGQILYRWLTSEIRNYCKHIRNDTFGIASDGEMDVIAARKILTTYLSCHGRFAKLSSLVKGLLGPWDRHWMRREWSVKKIQVASIEELHRAVWKEEILDIDPKNSLSKKGLEEVTDAVAVLREAEGGVAEYDLALVKDVVNSLSVLDLTLES